MTLEHRAAKIIFAIVVAASLALNTAILALNNSPQTLTNATYSEAFHGYFDPDQYAYLGDAFLHGRISLDLPVAEELAALEDPYSYDARWDISSEDVRVYWDYAFCDGEYYCYFGAVPALLLYAPYQLMTGQYLPTPYAVAFAAALGIIALALLTWRIARRYFSQTATIGTLLVAFLTLLLVCNFSYLTFVARFYSIPILFSVLFTCLGLWFWLGARRKAAGSAAPARLSSAHLAAGSLCIALNIGCRPQFILFALLAFFIFRKEIFEERLLFSRAGAGKTVAALLPFVLVGGLQMAYNFARFGSVLDFGSSRNLTGFNMREYSQNWTLTLIYFVFYLFRPLKLIGEFPFITSVNTIFPDLGWAPEEPFYGGIFVLVPVLFLVFALPFAFKTLRTRGVGWGLVACIALSLGVLLLDIRVAGITERYFSDFAIYLGIVAVFVLFALAERLQGSPTARRVFLTVLWVLTAFALCICALKLFSPIHFDSIATTNPELWSQICGIFGI